jgi:hypothetical protein
MKTWQAIIAAGLALGLGTAAVAQSASGAAAANNDAQTTAPASAQSNAIIERYMTSVDTELTSRLDTRNTPVGQEVTARTKQTAKLADGTTLPRGTKLVGHVTRVQAQTKDQPYAALAITFDRAELKGGQSVALRCVVRMVAPPASTVATTSVNTMAADQAANPLGAGTSVGGMGPAVPRGGLGGAGGGVVGATGRGVGQPPGVGPTTGSPIDAATADTRSLPQVTVPSAGGVVTQAGETVSAAPRATGLPGVVNVSGTLMASGRNISLDTGTQITLGVITQ